MSSKKITDVAKVNSLNDTDLLFINSSGSLKQITVKNSGMISKDLLWTNASPDSSFAAQKVSVDLSGYDYILLEYRGMSSSSHTEIDFIKVGTSRYITYTRFLQSEHILTMHNRSITAETTGVTFNTGSYHDYDAKTYTGDSNGVIVPVRIYGIKGAQ